MKKLISTLMFFTTLITLNPTNSYCAEADDPELYAFAETLGADTDFLGVVNYKHGEDNPLTREMYNEYLYKCSLLEAAYYPKDSFTTAASGGSCVGISLLEVLSHNGIISPDDIQNGADTLSEITLNDDVDKIITSYHSLQTFTEFNSYDKYLVYAQSYNEQIDSLIKTAESCMKENKYFFISIRGKRISHAVCGIGITDGEWEWNGNKYDKCVLTLDSNIKNAEGNRVGFSNKGCIYINSKTKESYLPAYELDMEENPAYAVISDENLLNYKGMINPSELDNDKYNINHFSYNTTENTKIYSIKDDIATLIEAPLFSDVLGPAALLTGEKIHIELNDEYKAFPNFRYINTDRWIDIGFEPISNADYCEYNGTVDIEDNLIAIENKSDESVISYVQLRLNDDTYGFSPYFLWSFDGNITDDFSMEIVENGILLKSTDRIDMTVVPERYVLDDDGKLQYTTNSVVTSYPAPEHNYCYINSDNDVLITIDDTDKIVCYIDDNGDEIYDVEVVKGDANYDGVINASDASAVLAHYAKLSTSSKRIPTDVFTMDYNQDNIVDASDASLILSYYSEVQTKN